MARNLFSVPIFFIIFRETVEAAIIVSVLLSFVEQLMTTGRFGPSSPGAKIQPTSARHELGYGNTSSNTGGLDSGVGPSIGQITAEEHGTGSKEAVDPEATIQANENEGERASLDDSERVRRILKRMRIQIWAGTIAGFLIALCIGAAFIAVFYTKLTDLWANTEQIWEGVFSLIAAFIIYLMGIAFLKMDRSRVKWRIKLSDAFDDRIGGALAQPGADAEAGRKSRWWRRGGADKGPKRAKGGKWALFLLPFITVLREGLEAVVFVGGVSLGQPAASIPIAVIVGLIAGGIVGYLIYRTGSSLALHWFLVVSTCILFLIGAGLFSKGAAFFEVYHFVKGVGADITESGAGPGSYQVQGNVYHLLYGNPETGAVGTNGGWQIFNAILGWNNNGTYASILCYVFYWVAVMLALVYYKFQEGRVTFCGMSSESYKRREASRAERARAERGSEEMMGKSSGSESSSPMEEKKDAQAMRPAETYHTLE